jgi:hypothetical protein
MPSCLNVSKEPEKCLRSRCSSQYCNILHLHWKFSKPVSYSRLFFFFNFTKLSFVFFWKILNIPPTHPLRPLNMNNACPYRISAAAGTALARTSSPKIRHYPFCRKSFTTKLAFLTHSVLLDQAFAHCPKFPTAASYNGAWAVSQSQCGCTSVKTS